MALVTFIWAVFIYLLVTEKLDPILGSIPGAFSLFFLWLLAIWDLWKRLYREVPSVSGN